jgi:A nuclease of the HNH/ENDO VII superfamily with conserved LHH
LASALQTQQTAQAAADAAAAGTVTTTPALQIDKIVVTVEAAAERVGVTLLDVGAGVAVGVAYLLSPGSGGANNSNDTIQGVAEAHHNSGGAEPQAASGGARKGGDRDRMREGKAPIGADGYPVELHHPGQKAGAVQEMTRTDHRLGGNYRANHPEGNKIKSRINRAEAARQRREYWQQKAREEQ